MQTTKHRHAAIVGTTLLAICGVLRANPNHQDFDAGLAVHGKTLSPELQQRAQALYESANEALIGFAKTANKSRLDGKKLGQAYLMAIRLDRRGRQLRLLGEPAGVDYISRAETLRSNLSKIILAFKSFPTTQRFIESIRLQIRKQEQLRAKTLVKVQELTGQQKWEQAEAELYALLDTLETGLVFLTPGERSSIQRPFNQIRDAVDQAMFHHRLARANELLRQSRQAQTPDFAGVTAQMMTAAQALSSSAAVPWAGESLTGPQLVEQFGQKWREVQIASLRCRALDWALYRRDASEFKYKVSIPSANSESGADIDAQMGQFKASASQAIAQAVAADAQRASADDAVVLYHQYLNVLAPLVRQSDLRELAAIVEPPLENLAAKAETFAQEVTAYRAATDELLRWRRRVAAGRAAAQASGYPSIEKPFYEATRNDGKYAGLFPSSGANPATPALQASAPQAVDVATQRLMGQPVTSHDVIRLPGQSRAAIARYRMRTYVNTPANLNVQNELNALKSDLMVNDQAFPLTLAATQSLISADRGDFVSVGGSISGLHLESLITRFATLPPQAAVLIPLGGLPRVEARNKFLSQMMMRFDLQPQWAQHDHFFVNLAPSSNAAASQ